jgi:hypothetical protein
MTPEEETTFIGLWNQGLPTAAIAQQLHIPEGTARSRAYLLQQRGKIPARPKGGRRIPAPAPAPAPTTTMMSTRDTPAMTFVAVAEVRELISTVKDLSARVRALEQGPRGTTRTTPAQTPPRVAIKQWTVRLSQGLIDAVKAQAMAQGKEPSHVVEELLWLALSLAEEDRRVSQRPPT